MDNPTNLEMFISLILLWIKELSIISLLAFLIRMTWKMTWWIRGFYDDAKLFFARIEKHMTVMESFAVSITHIIAKNIPVEIIQESHDSN